MGTAPANFPPNPLMPVTTGVQAGNKLGLTAGFLSTPFFTAPETGYYEIGWACHIEQTDGAGSLAVTVTPPNSVAIPGVQPALGTPSDGKGPVAPYFMSAGQQVTVAVVATSLGTTIYDMWVFATRVN